jgi:hypothetical protein
MVAVIALDFKEFFEATDKRLNSPLAMHRRLD